MRRDASNAESSRPVAALALATLLAALAVLTLLFSANAAPAGPVANQRPLLFRFDGHDTTAGRFTHPGQLAFDEASGDVYVLNTAGTGQGTGPEQEPSKRAIDKFDAEGKAQSFAHTGTSSLTGTETPGGAFGVEGFFGTGAGNTDLAVDNSGGAGGGEQGRIYVLEGKAARCTSSTPKAATSAARCPVRRSNRTASRWTAKGTPGSSIGLNGKAREFANSGLRPRKSCATIGDIRAQRRQRLPRQGAIDRTGADLYVADKPGRPSPIVEKYVSGVPDSRVTTERTRDLTVSQSSALPSPATAGHLFTVQQNGFQEFRRHGQSPGAARRLRRRSDRHPRQRIGRRRRHRV